MRRIADRRVPVGTAGDPDPRGSANAGRAPAEGARRARAQPQEHRRRHPARAVRVRHGRERVGQVHAGAGGAAPGADAEGVPVAACRASTGGSSGGSRSTRSSTSTSRPSAGRRARTPRPTPACSTTSASCSPGAGGADTRLPAGPVLVQRSRRAVRELRRRRADQDRDALPARRVRHLRGVQGPAVQPGDARGAVQEPLDRGRARDERRRGARVLPEHPGRSSATCRRCPTSASGT